MEVADDPGWSLEIPINSGWHGQGLHSTKGTQMCWEALTMEIDNGHSGTCFDLATRQTTDKGAGLWAPMSESQRALKISVTVTPFLSALNASYLNVTSGKKGRKE